MTSWTINMQTNGTWIKWTSTHFKNVYKFKVYFKMHKNTTHINGKRTNGITLGSALSNECTLTNNSMHIHWINYWRQVIQCNSPACTVTKWTLMEQCALVKCTLKSTLIKMYIKNEIVIDYKIYISWTYITQKHSNRMHINQMHINAMYISWKYINQNVH